MRLLDLISTEDLNRVVLGTDSESFERRQKQNKPLLDLIMEWVIASDRIPHECKFHAIATVATVVMAIDEAIEKATEKLVN